MKNYQKGFIVPLIWAVVVLLAIGLGSYVYFNQKTEAPSINQVLSTVPTTSDSITQTQTTINQSASTSPSNTEDSTYQNGKITGVIKSVDKDNSGKTTLGIDIVQTFSGKEAFLASAEDFNNGTNKFGDWSLVKDKFKTFVELSKYVRSLSDSQFEDFFYSYQKIAQEKSSLGIFGEFPNGFTYTRNSSNKIRYYSVDKNLKKINISNSSEAIDIGDLYYACTVSEEKWHEFIDKKTYSSSFDCTDQISFTVSQGVITDMEILYRP